MHQKKIPRVKRSILHSIPWLKPIGSMNTLFRGARPRRYLRFAQILGRRLGRKCKTFSSLGLLPDSLQGRGAQSRRNCESPRKRYSMELNLSNNSITSNNTKLFRYLSSSIPLACMVALLLLGLGLIIPIEKCNVAYADEGDSATNSPLAFSSSSPSTASSNSSRSATTASLTIGGDALNQTIEVAPGTVAYRSHTVSVNASAASNYTLSISGPVGLAGDSTITGSNNQTPSMMPADSWGYAYGQTGSNDTMTYQSFSPTAKVIDSGTNQGDFTKSLVFAAKFSNGATAGHYTGQVILSLVAVPR